MQQHKIRLVNNDQERKFEIWEGSMLKASLTPGQFSDLMMEIKRFIEERNPKRVAVIQRRRERKIRRMVYWMMFKQKVAEWFQKYFGVK